jgi:hypothetical protein
LNAEQSAAQTAEILAEESQEIETWWWLSFADDNGFRGAAMVRGRGILSAVHEASRLGLNPGGDVAGLSLQDHEPPSEWVGRLLTREGVAVFNSLMSAEPVLPLPPSPSKKG